MVGWFCVCICISVENNWLTKQLPVKSNMLQYKVLSIFQVSHLLNNNFASGFLKKFWNWRLKCFQHVCQVSSVFFRWLILIPPKRKRDLFEMSGLVWKSEDFIQYHWWKKKKLDCCESKQNELFFKGIHWKDVTFTVSLLAFYQIWAKAGWAFWW